MSYRCEFDDTWDGNLRLRRASYESLQGVYRGLRDELEAWNRRALEHGGSTPPYEQEVDDLNSMLAWGGERLAHAARTSFILWLLGLAGAGPSSRRCSAVKSCGATIGSKSLSRCCSMC